MTRFLVPLLGLFLLTGSAVAGYALSASPAYASEKASEGKEGEPKISFIAMDPIILPIIDRDGVTQTISLVVSLQVGNAADADEVKANLPRLTDAYLSDMYGTLSAKSAMQSGVIKVSMLKARLVKISQAVMGKDKINDVLLQVLQQHPV
jgi:flagellar FliL protein